MNVLWLLLCLFLILKVRNHRHCQLVAYSAIFWFFITGTKFIPDLMVYGLEKQYDAIAVDKLDKKNIQYIHVLGGGSYYDIHLPDQEKLSQASLARLNEGLRIYKALPGSKLIFSGHSSTGGVNQAKITADAANGLGIHTDDIFILETPATTEEEAIEYSRKYGAVFNNPILVTSDVHMPRAMQLFKKQGLDPVPAPSDHILRKHYINGKTSFWWSSNRNNFDKFYAAMHEYIGILWASM